MKLEGYKPAVTEEIFHSDCTRVSRLIFDDDREPLVLKELISDHRNSSMITAFRYEQEMLQLFDSPSIISFVDFISSDDSHYLLTEDGGSSLKDVFTDLPDPEQWIDLAKKITVAVSEVHRHGVIHKDICPENIVIHPDTGDVKLIDFGIASHLPREKQFVDTSGVLEGSLSYISPEQTGRMNQPLDYRSDFYSLGICFYELLTGALPFQADDITGWVHAHMALVPLSPSELRTDIPSSFSSVIMKLLAKSPEERYQSSLGIIHDLEQCRLDLHGHLSGSFVPGTADVSERFVISDTIIGREREIEILKESFNRMNSGKSEIVLIDGYSGVGKTSLIHEFQKSFADNKGLFLSAKYERFHRKSPFQALSDAFSGFVTVILTRSELELEEWRRKILDTLQESSQVIVDIIPQLELIIGVQPPAPAVDPRMALNRQIYIFKKFLRLIADEEHPLTLFLDDLQWGDYSTLRLLESILLDKEIDYLQVIMAYRSNEVDREHVLTGFKERLAVERIFIELTVPGLSCENVSSLLADTLNQEIEIVEPLAQKVYKKTGGNPFFVRVMLFTLFRNSEISFTENGRWEFDLERVEEMELSDNVVDIMLNIINAFPEKNLELLKTASAIGNGFDLYMLSTISGETVADTAKLLIPVLREKIIVPLQNEYPFIQIEEGMNNISYLFQHDKVMQTVYSLMSNERRAAVHYKIGRALLDSAGETETAESVTDIVQHLNLAPDHLSENERLILCSLNVKVGKKAKLSIAYDSALQYLETAESLLPEESWISHYDLTTEIFILSAELSYLNGRIEEANAYIDVLKERLRSNEEIADVLRRQVPYIIMSEGNIGKALEVGISAIHLLEADYSETPDEDDVIGEYKILQSYISSYGIASITDLPMIEDQGIYRLIKTIIPVLPAAFFNGEKNILYYSVLKVMNLSIKYGNSSEATFAYVNYSLALPDRLVDPEKAFEFAEMGLLLSRQMKDVKFRGSLSYVTSAYTYIWIKPIEETVGNYEKAYELCRSDGDVFYANFALGRMVYDANFKTLDEALNLFQSAVARITSKISEFSAIRSSLHYHCFAGKTRDSLSCDTEIISEKDLLSDMKQRNDLLNISGYYVIKMTIFLVFEEPNNLYALYDSISSYLYRLYYQITGCFYSFMNITQMKDLITPELKVRILGKYDLMKRWCDKCDINIRQFQKMMEAELLRMDGNEYGAICCYEEAISFSERREFREYLALAEKLLGKYYLELGKTALAQLYLTKAYETYELWGAKRVCEFLMEKYGDYITGSSQGNRSGPSEEKVSVVDLDRSININAVITASHTLSGEMSLEKLLSQFIRTIQENAGAQRILFILKKDDHWFIEAERCESSEISLLLHEDITPSRLPISMMNYVKRARKEVLIGNASSSGIFTEDPYITESKVRSVFMLPIISRERMCGILYLENKLTSNLFTAERLEVIRLLTAQVAVSVENAQLYTDLEAQVQLRTQQLTESNRELSLARKEAERASLAKTDFIANMSHEIRTPMNAILGFSEIMRDRVTDELNKHYLSSIYSSGNALLTLINDILDLSKVESGKLSIEYGAFSLLNLLDEIDTLFSQRAEGKGLYFTIHCDKKVPSSLFLDETRLRQVLINLVANALKFTSGGMVSVSAAVKKISADDKVDLIIKVADSGIGIKKDDFERIFESFEQATGRSQANYGGTGLGLVITRRLVEMMNGDIDVQSVYGEGSIFTVTFHGVETKGFTGLTELKSDELTEEVIFDRASIMIVDKHDDNRELLKGFLSSYNFSFTEVDNYKNVMSAVENCSPDLIIFCTRIPDSRNEAQLLEIRERENSAVPVIVVTASAFLKEESEISSLCNSLVHKPILRSDLIAEVQRFLPHKISSSKCVVEKGDLPHILPGSTYLKQLLQLAQCGFLDDIYDSVDETASADSKFTPFALKIKKLSRGFLENELVTYLTECLEVRDE